MSGAFTGKAKQHRAEVREERAGQEIRDMSRELFETTSGLRSETLGTLNRVLAGERPENFRIFAPEREAVESQFRSARENIIASSPARGGQLNRLLAGTDIARAQTLGGMEADVRRSAFEQSLGLGFQTPVVSLAGLGSAAGIFGAAANRSQQDVAGGKSGAGSLVGLAAAAAIACWIAEALYGRGSREFYLARLWIFELWEGPVADVTRALYRRFGARAARCPWLVACLRPLFDRAVRNAAAVVEVA